MNDLVGRRLGRYEIVKLLGAGGMGEVYRARDTQLGRQVAVKVLGAKASGDASRLARFEREAHAVALLSHPNILDIHDFGVDSGVAYAVTELLEGHNLRDRMRGSPLPLSKALEIGRAVANGLASAHAQGIVHRDVKPENIFITSTGQVKILDFGIARLKGDPGAESAGADATTATETGIGQVIGTVGYMSPEQVRGLPVGPRSDIFSLGCVLYEMVTGRRAFHAETPADTMLAILDRDPPAMATARPDVPAALSLVVSRCLEKQPDERFESARDVAFALQAVSLTAETVGTGRRGWTRLGSRAIRIRAIALGGVGVAALATLAVVWLAKVGRSRSLPPFHQVQVTGHFGIESQPAISPGGNEIAYAVKENGKSSIWITDIRGGNPLRLTDRPTQAEDPAWFPDGSAIAFSSEEGLTASIWKVSRFGGTPRLLVPNGQQSALSPDGTRIAFVRRAEQGFLRIWVADLAELDQARRITGPGDGVFDHYAPAWSPDSRTICYCDARDLWLVPADGGRARPLTRDDAADQEPVWSADGRFVYFASIRNGTEALWRVSAGGGPPVRVTDGTGSEQFPSLSRDGRRLAFVSRLRSGSIALADLRTGKVARTQESSFAVLPAIAPDRSALVFVSQLGGSAALRSLPLRDSAPAGESVVLTEQPGSVASPAFSPDGRWVAYYLAVGGQRDVWVVPAHGGPPVNFSAHQGQDVQPVWSPDSAKIAFVSNRGGAYQIWVAPFSNGRRVGEPRRVSSEAGTAGYPSWSPDGRTIAYVLLTERGKEVWMVSADGSGQPRRLTSSAQAYSLRWFGVSGQILVSGFWGELLPTFRLLSPTSGELRPFALPAGVVLDPEMPDFDLSLDGGLLALFEGRSEGVIWVREAEKGSF
jgi:Tol biopolymer transport system component